MKTLSRFLLASLLLTLIATSLAFCFESFTHISTIYPELEYLDSVYINARGLPHLMWATVDSNMLALAEPVSKFLIEGILFNFVFYFMVSSFILGFLVSLWKMSKIYRVARA